VPSTWNPQTKDIFYPRLEFEPWYTDGMKVYLSSYRLGDHSDELVRLVDKKEARVAVCVNALDAAPDESRNGEVLTRELGDMRGLGFEAEEIDLRDYFNKEGLLEKMREFDAVWFSGGNSFLLVKAFRQSGFGEVLEQLVRTNKLVYAGYSAAFCAVSPSLHGVELVDDKDVVAKGYETGDVWEGFSLIDFYPIVHFRSNHHESDLVEEEYDYVCKNNIKHKTFKDGDVYLVDGEKEFVLTSDH